MYQLQEPVRLSQSRLWSLTEEFYENKGLSAWTEDIVPTRISSNPMIAHAYAQVILGYLRDVAKAYLERGQEGRAPVVTIIELGAGTGQFGFLLTRALEAAVAAVKQNAPVAAFRVLVTDVAKSNVEAWTRDERFRPFVDSGVMDFAVLDVARPTKARSALSGLPIDEILDGDPAVLIANYVFDSLVLDAFMVDNGELFELKVGLDLEAEPKHPIVGSYDLFTKIKFRGTPEPVGFPYYNDALFDRILDDYRRHLSSGVFLFPATAMSCMDSLRALAGGRLLTLVGDKTLSDLSQIEGRNSLGIHLTGSFSSYVNIDAIARWVGYQGGFAKLPDPAHQRFDVFAFVLGDIGGVGETDLAYHNHVRLCGPAHFHWIVSSLVEARGKMQPRQLIALLKMSRYDPHVLRSLGPQFMEGVAQADRNEKTQFKAALEACAANHFAVSDRQDPWFTIGRLFQELGEPKRALACYDKAKSLSGNSLLVYNMALCCAELGQSDEALACLRRAVSTQLEESRKKGAASA